MYGEAFYPNFYLRYQLTLDFFEKFQSLSFSGIELPLILMNSYHFFIKNYVDQITATKRNLHPAVQDLQLASSRKPDSFAYLATPAGKKTILISASLCKLATKQFVNEKVVLLVSNKKEEEAIKELRMPNHFEVVYLKQMLDQTPFPMELETMLQKKIKVIVKNHLDHDIFGLPHFATWLLNACIKGIRMVLLLKKIILTRNIGMIIEQSQNTFPGNVLSLLSIQFKVPFIFIQQRLITDIDIWPSRATFYCVWGNNYKEWLIKKGIPSEQIIITGSLAIEEKFLSFHGQQKNLRQLLNLPPHLFFITFTTQPFMKQVNEQIMDWVSDVFQNLPICILIKKHPFDPFDYSSYLNKPYIMECDLDLYEIISQTDLVMTISSTTGIESLLFHKGLLILQPHIPLDYHIHYNDFHAHFVKGAAGVAIYSKEELMLALKNWIENEDDRNEMIQQGQKFLIQTLKTDPLPSTSIKTLVDKLL